jgi:putative ABC transport system permease protein
VLKAGNWFDGTATEPQISVERIWVDMLHLKLGDTLSFAIAEGTIEARISSIREADWTSFRVNFFVLLDPASATALPHSFIASYWLPAERAVELRAISREFPNLSMIDINAILDRVRDIIDQVSSAVMAVLGFSLIAGLLVLIAALNVSAEERRFETAMLRTLGARRGQLLATVLGEFALLGFIAGLIAAVGAISAGLSLGRGVFRIAWSPPLLPFALGVLAAVALVTLAGWLGTRSIARTSPLLVLRKE